MFWRIRTPEAFSVLPLPECAEYQAFYGEGCGRGYAKLQGGEDEARQAIGKDFLNAMKAADGAGRWRPRL
jgi:hypothetical protein